MDTSRWDIFDRDGIRYLCVRGADWSMSSMPIDQPHRLSTPYMRTAMGFVLFRPQPRDVLMLGLGAGSQAKYMLHHLDGVRVTCVELDPTVPPIARQHFHLPPDHARLRVVIDDAVRYVSENPASADAVLVDVYVATGAPPESITCPAFYRALHAVLRPAGVAVFNFHGMDLDRLVTQLAALRLRFADVRAALAPPANSVVFALRDPVAQTPVQLIERAEALEPQLRLGLPDLARELAVQVGMSTAQLLRIACGSPARDVVF